MGFKEIGKKIQLAREEKGMTQSGLAEALGITQAALSNYELGKRRLYLYQIQKIAEIVEKKLNFFISQEDYALEDDSLTAKKGRGGDVDSLMRRITRLGGDDLSAVEEFLDFLEWRRKRDV